MSNLKGSLSVGQGARGKSIEFMWRGTELGLRVEGDLEYQFTNLAVEGSQGKEIQLQVYGGYIQWKYAGEEIWNNLIALSELKGDKGEQGLPGIAGVDGITPNITIGTVTTLEPNQQATVTNSGTKENPIFNFGIPKGEQGKPPVYELITTPIVDSTLTLTTDKYQTTTMEDNTTIILPSVSNYTEIHLFFSTESEFTLILPQCKWQGDIIIESGKTYEFIFTYYNEWLGGCVCYE